MNFNNYAIYINDPSAGSPTETLLRLLLPLNNRVCKLLELLLSF